MKTSRIALVFLLFISAIVLVGCLVISGFMIKTSILYAYPPTAYIVAYLCAAIATGIPLITFLVLVNSVNKVLLWVKFLVAILAPGLIVLLMYLIMKDRIIPSIFNENFDRMVAPACQGYPVKGAAEYQPGPGSHPIVLIHDNSSIRDVPDEWLPKSLGAVELVACVGKEEKVNSELCHYDDGSKIQLVKHQVTVQLVAASTGQLLKTITVEGPALGCPVSTTSSIGTSTKDAGFVYTEDLTKVLIGWVLP